MRAILCFCSNSIKPPHAHLGCGFDSLSAIEMIMFGNDAIIDTKIDRENQLSLITWRQNGNTKEGARRKKERKCASQKFVVLSRLAPLKISKMRTDDNITKKPAHSFVESN
jgi:hypothetical protein